jgi:hypothetical protein
MTSCLKPLIPTILQIVIILKNEPFGGGCRQPPAVAE